MERFVLWARSEVHGVRLLLEIGCFFSHVVH
ncbi:hypothetical protein JOC55_000871 [Paenibacillus sacheonensis]|nr:hypothetical protein [Paenibacillus sacheonensis]